ncbi:MULTISPECIES: sensor histidine kinase [Streptomyces]|uniref:histidine kinase n=2 Tax=Streptomyces TaxID=1883 RepID=A0A100Y6W4_9ACTN|nr:MULTISPECIES: HAMP domain-containing sensor histidine kinase [Streptomyces]KUH38790.1 histidine kinase [Streptomyces kanasensis]UUS34409.1 HAMP domain-containing histidine kinase [Streptomyces changanensis]
MRSVRARAALGATLVVAVALVAVGVVLLQVLRSNLIGQAGLQAEIAAREVASQIALDRPLDRLDLPDGDERPVQVVEEGGRVTAVSEGLEAVTGTSSRTVAPLPSSASSPGGGQDDGDDTDGGADGNDDDAPARGEVSADPPRFTSGSATVEGRAAEYRFAAVEVTSGVTQRTYTVYAGAPLAAERDAVGTVRTAMLIGLPVLLAVVGSVTWLVTRRALRPVEAIRSQMAAITASEDLSHRVPEPASRDEVARLARTTNETLAALEASVERQRRFVADASHELRSPIASLRTQLEVGAAHPELLDLDGAVQDTQRLQHLAADLLLLARLDAGERPAARRVDMAELVREEVARRHGDRLPVTVAVDGEGCEVTGSAGQLRRVVANLLDNAQRHATASVSVSVRAAAGRVEVAVCDDGAGVPEADIERIFERFVRLDDARTRDEGGAGLGLAIARDVAGRHGGTLTVGAAEGGGARFLLSLPGATGTEPAPTGTGPV